jgi:hypothetical protein
VGISPMYQFQTGKPWTPTLTYDSGKAVDLTGLSGSAFTLIIQDTRNLNTPDRNGQGTFSIVNPAAGQISYKWNVADTSILGKFQLIVQYIDTDGTTVDCDPVPWQILPI